MEKTVTIKNEEGLHARPAGAFVRCANQFKAEVEVEANGRRINGKSIMSLMGLGLVFGSAVKIIASGEDASDAVGALAELVDSKFSIDADSMGDQAHAQ